MNSLFHVQIFGKPKQEGKKKTKTYMHCLDCSVCFGLRLHTRCTYIRVGLAHNILCTRVCHMIVDVDIDIQHRQVMRHHGHSMLQYW